MIISHDYFKTAQAFIPDQQYVKARPKLLEQYYDFNVTSTSARQDPHIGGNLCLDPILPGPEYLVQRARSRIFSRKYVHPRTQKTARLRFHDSIDHFAVLNACLGTMLSPQIVRAVLRFCGVHTS
jgi:hypothetical protein